MNRPTLYEIKIIHVPADKLLLSGAQFLVDSINRYARDEKHAESIGRKFARETLKAVEVERIETRILNL